MLKRCGESDAPRLCSVVLLFMDLSLFLFR